MGYDYPFVTLKIRLLALWYGTLLGKINAMIFAYAVGRIIFVALDRKAGQLVLSFRDRRGKHISTFHFNDTDFEKLEVATSESVIVMEMDMDGQRFKRKIYLSEK